MLVYIENHLKKQAEALSRRNEIDGEISKRLKRIERAKKQIESLENKRCNFYASWIDDIVKPLSKDLERLVCEETGEEWHSEIFGPFGIFARTSIFIRKNLDDSCNQTIYHLSVVPPGDDGSMEYGTGKFCHKYPKGSIADLNGENEIMALLPDTVEEIWEIVKRKQEENL